MEEVRKLKQLLPGIDCGACGSPGCEALAGDIVNGERSINNCVFMQLVNQKRGKLQVDEAIALMEEIWGKDIY